MAGGAERLGAVRGNATTLRVAVLGAADAPTYKALMLHAYAHAADAFTSTPEERAREPDSWWVQRIANPTGLTMGFGAFDGGALVGTVALDFSAKPKTRHKALLVAMFVHEDHRGTGAARQLLEAAIAQCRRCGDIRVLQLEVTDGNLPAQRLYQRLGFQAYGVEPLAVLTPGGYRSKVHMWLDLAPRQDAA